jgi:CBS domain-containing protein
MPLPARSVTIAESHRRWRVNVGEIMSEQPVCVTPETDIVNAAMRMKDHELGALPVCEKERLVGIITKRDIVYRYLAGWSHQGRLVAHYMTRDPVTICPEDSLERAEALMSQYQIRRLPVCKHGRLIGMIEERHLPATRTSGHRKASRNRPMQPLRR